VNATPGSVSVQYSDAVNVTIGISDTDSTSGSVSARYKVGSGAFAAGLPSGLTLPWTWSGSPTTAALGGQALVAPGSYTIEVTASDGINSGSTLVMMTVTQEDATVTYTGPNVVYTPPGGSTATVPLSADVLDAADGARGNITNARVSFRIDGSTSYCQNLTPTLVNPSDATLGRVSCNWPGVGLTTNDSHDIDIYINGFYVGSSLNNLLEVVQPDGNFITGGGYLTMSSSAGTYAATAGSKMNFGFNVKYNKGSKPQPQGHINVIFRRGGNDFQIKSTSINSLTIGYTGTCANPPVVTLNCTGTATFDAKANLTNVTTGVSVCGSGQCTVSIKMVDKGEPGRADTLSVEVRGSGNSLVFSSNYTGSLTIQQLLSGGNLVVH
jgi:hypothetical protein